MKTFNISEPVYIAFVKQLTTKVEEYCNLHGQPTHLVAVARGGLIPAQYIAYQLGIQQVYSIGVYSYHGKERQEIKPYQALPIFDIERPVFLIIDNLVDSGNTFSFILNHLDDVYPECKCITAALFKKNRAKFIPHVFIKEVEQEMWIEFPYEPEDS